MHSNNYVAGYVFSSFFVQVLLCFEIKTTNEPNLSNDEFENICRQQNCRRKCCETGYFFDVRLHQCLHIEQYSIDIQEWKVREDWRNSTHLVTGFPPNPINETINKTRFCGFYKQGDYKIQQNGQLLLFQRDTTYSSDFYCIDNYYATRLIVQYFGLSSTCWLNLAIYEIFRVIRGTMQLRPLQQLRGTSKRYYSYMIYACGFPLLVSSITVTLQYLPDEAIASNIRDYIIRPDIGDGRCWFKDNNGAVYAYYYGIEAAILLIDTILIIYTAITLKMGRSSQFQMKSHSNKNHLQLFWQQFFTIALYIFVWIMNCLALIYPRMDFWGVVNVIVAMQGLFLLIIVIRSRNYILAKKMSSKVITTTTSIYYSVRNKRGNWDISNSSTTEKHRSITQAA